MNRRSISPAWGLLEIAALGGLFLVTLWFVGPSVETNGAALAFYWFALATWTVSILWLSPIVLHHDPPSLRGWGLGRSVDDPGAVRNAWPAYAGFTTVAATGLMIVMTTRDTAFLVHTPWLKVGHKLLIYLVYGPVQALVFFGYVQTRLRTAAATLAVAPWLTRLVVVLSTSLLFAAVHIPNWPLSAMVLAVGLCWSWLYYARPNVLLMGVSHAVLGTIVYSILGVYTRIGPFYAHPEGHIARNAIPGLKALVGDLF